MSLIIKNSGVNYTLYYNVMDYFKEIMSNHPSIFKVTQGEISDIDAREYPEYPFGNVLITQAVFGETVTNFSIQLTVADKIKNRNNESSGSTNAQTIPFYGVDDTVDIHANTLAILNDLTSYTQRSVDGLQIDGDIVCTPFSDRFNNGLAGWVADFDLTVHNDRNICLFPLLSVTTTTSGPTTTTTAGPTTTTTTSTTTTSTTTTSTTTTTTAGPTTTTTAGPTTTTSTTTAGPTTTTTTQAFVADVFFFGIDGGAGLIYSSSYTKPGSGNQMGFGGSNFIVKYFSSASLCDSGSLKGERGRVNDAYGLNAPGQFSLSSPYTSGSIDIVNDKQLLSFIEVTNGIFVSQSGQVVVNGFGDPLRVNFMVTCSKYP